MAELWDVSELPIRKRPPAFNDANNTKARLRQEVDGHVSAPQEVMLNGQRGGAGGQVTN